jgi:dGTPase
LPYREIHKAIEMQFPGATARERFYEALRHLIDTLVSALMAAFTAEAARTSRELKQFLYRRVYSSDALQEGRSHSMAMIEHLFQFFLDHPERLPQGSQGYREQSEDQPPHRVTCDYIAGMTDGFFRRTYDAMLGVQGVGS